MYGIHSNIGSSASSCRHSPAPLGPTSATLLSRSTPKSTPLYNISAPGYPKVILLHCNTGGDSLPGSRNLKSKTRSCSTRSVRPDLSILSRVFSLLWAYSIYDKKGKGRERGISRASIVCV